MTKSLLVILFAITPLVHAQTPQQMEYERQQREYRQQMALLLSACYRSSGRSYEDVYCHEYHRSRTLVFQPVRSLLRC
jgi:hypothetical protein